MIWQYRYFLQSKHRISSLCLPVMSEVDLVFYQRSTSGSMLLCFSPGWQLIVDAASRCPWSPLDLSSSGQQLGGDQHQRISFLRSLHLISPHQTEILNSLWPLWGHFLLFNSNSEWILGVSLFGRWQRDIRDICRQFADVHETMTQHSTCLFICPFKGRVCTAPCQRRNLVHEGVRRCCFDLSTLRHVLCAPQLGMATDLRVVPQTDSVSAGSPLVGAGIRTWACCFCTLILCMIEMT